MEKLMLKRTQIPCIPGISWDHKKWYSGCRSINPISSGYGAHYNFKGTSLNLPLHSVLKPNFLTAKGPGKTTKRDLLWVHVIRASSSSNNGGEDAPDQSKHYKNLFSVFAGIIGCLIRLSRGILGVFYREKRTFEKIEEKIETAVEIVEEVAESVKDVAEVTEEIAEKIERHSKEGGIVHETAEIVDEISERVGRDAEIVENQVEKMKKTIKTMEEKVGKAEDAVKDIAETISEEKDGKQHDKDKGGAENSSIPKVETEKDNKSMDSVEVVSKSDFEDVGFKELLRRLIWLLFWATKLSPKILGATFFVIFFGETLIGTSVTCYSQFMASLMS